MHRTRKINAMTMPVKTKPCRTCPFAGRTPVELDPEALIEYTRKIVTLQSQHLCHTADNKQICRGGRDIMLRVMVDLKLIDAPTDDAFERKSREVLKPAARKEERNR